MNLRKLLPAVIVALIQGCLMLQHIAPDDLSYYIGKNEHGYYDLKDLGRRSEVIVTEPEGGMTHILIKQTLGFWHYFTAVIVAYLFFQLFFYIEIQKKRNTTVKSELEAIKPDKVKLHPKYNAFLEENSDRSFSGEELATVFSSWLHRTRKK